MSITVQSIARNPSPVFTGIATAVGAALLVAMLTTTTFDWALFGSSNVRAVAIGLYVIAAALGVHGVLSFMHVRINWEKYGTEAPIAFYASVLLMGFAGVLLLVAVSVSALF